MITAENLIGLNQNVQCPQSVSTKSCGVTQTPFELVKCLLLLSKCLNIQFEDVFKGSRPQRKNVAQN